MASTLTKVAMVVAVWVVLLHSSMGQQQPASPPPPPPYCSDCSATCTQECERIVAGNQASYCSSVPDAVYKFCLGDCANSTCHGHYGHRALGRCSIGTCTPQHCGKHCLKSCCKSCTDKARHAFDGCVGSRGGSSMQNCMDGCMDGCKHNCITQ